MTLLFSTVLSILAEYVLPVVRNIHGSRSMNLQNLSGSHRSELKVLFILNMVLTDHSNLLLISSIHRRSLKNGLNRVNAKPGDLILILAGDRKKTLTALSELSLEMGNRLNLRTKDRFVPLWVVDFPLLEWDDETSRYYAMHHPFTSPKPEDIHLMETDPGKVRANAYDLVINGVEIGGGSIRIHDSDSSETDVQSAGIH